MTQTVHENIPALNARMTKYLTPIVQENQKIW